MGATLSDNERDNERDFGDAFTLQQQRAQFRMLQQQLQDARNIGALSATQGDIRPLALALAGGPAALRPVQMPSLRMSRVFKNPAHLDSKTLSFGKNGTQPAIPSVNFSCDASAPGTITAYWSAMCATDANGGLVVKSSEWHTSMSFQDGLGQDCLLDWQGAEPYQAPSRDASKCAYDDNDDWTSGICSWPLLVELRVDLQSSDDKAGEQVRCAEWTMVRVLDVPGLEQSAAEIVGQKVACGDAPALDLQEVFGSEVAADSSARADCIVCQCEPRDTMVLPCRHLCLCSACGEYIRTRVQYHSYKCPICRKQISQMMQVNESSTEGITWADSEAAIDIGVASSEGSAEA